MRSCRLARSPVRAKQARLVRRCNVQPTNENINQIRRARAAAAVANPYSFVWSSAYSRRTASSTDALPRLVVWKGLEPSPWPFQLDVTTAAGDAEAQRGDGLPVVGRLREARRRSWT